MRKLFIKYRKENVLPKKWEADKKKKAKGISLPSAAELLDIQKNVTEKKFELLRRSDNVKVQKIQGIEEFLDALLRSSTEDYLKEL